MFAGRESETPGNTVNHGLGCSIGQITKLIYTDFFDICKDKIGRIDLWRYRPHAQANSWNACRTKDFNNGREPIVATVAPLGADSDLPGGESEIVADNYDLGRFNVLLGNEMSYSIARAIHVGGRFHQVERITAQHPCGVIIRPGGFGKVYFQISGHDLCGPETEIVATVLVFLARVSQEDHRVFHAPLIAQLNGESKAFAVKKSSK